MVRDTVSATLERTGEPPEIGTVQNPPSCFHRARERDSLPVRMPPYPADAPKFADDVREDLLGRCPVEPGEIDGWNYARGILQRRPDYEK